MRSRLFSPRRQSSSLAGRRAVHHLQRKSPRFCQLLRQVAECAPEGREDHRPVRHELIEGVVEEFYECFQLVVVRLERCGCQRMQSVNLDWSENGLRVPRPHPQLQVSESPQRQRERS